MTLQELLGIELPIIQAPMAGSQGSELAIAVSNAGGLGSLPCALLTLDALRGELEAIRAGTRKPYNVNFFCHAAPVPESPRVGLARRARAVPSGARHRRGRDCQRGGARAIQRRSRRPARGVPTRRG